MRCDGGKRVLCACKGDGGDFAVFIRLGTALEQVRLVLLELPNAEMLTAEEISALAGTPAEMAANHTEQSVETLLQHHYKTKLIYASLASLLVLALAATAIFCVQNGAVLQGYDGFYGEKLTPEEQQAREEQQRLEDERAYYEKIGREALEGHWN